MVGDTVIVVGHVGGTGVKPDKMLPTYRDDQWVIGDLPDPDSLRGYGMTKGSTNGTAHVFTGMAHASGDDDPNEIAAVVTADGKEWALGTSDDVVLNSLGRGAAGGRFHRCTSMASSSRWAISGLAESPG